MFVNKVSGGKLKKKENKIKIHIDLKKEKMLEGRMKELIRRKK